MAEQVSLSIIGGSGLYEMPGLRDTREYNIYTPFGRPSAPIIVGTLEGTRVAFLARHGIGHHITPTEVPYRANIYALKSLGTPRIISISACGSLKEEPQALMLMIRGVPSDFKAYMFARYGTSVGVM